MAEESVKVAVRVRPFNQREKDRKAKLIIKMINQTTTIEDPDNIEEPKSFTFDYSYWSHDGFIEKEDGFLIKAPNSNYASQQQVFDDLGKGVIKNAFDGFNCSLFAYGQTGSGKSYSMVGYGINKGIVPITCEVLFDKIGKSQDKYEITFSMLEIYNEQVNDLLCKSAQKGGLQVRQHPSQGYFYAQGLKRIPVGSYKEIEMRIEEGTANRTVASTNMNATSSRAHTVVTITFDQIFSTSNGETKKSSVINLIDLAGSERADSTGATGDRLKEGANINKSLSALGNVISALADISSGTKKKVVVPYRDSVLTKLLQNALGGNSKTIMIAALSPADINYGETLSTLRYADRAKRIKTKAVVNENPIDKLIRELKEENDRLKNMLESGSITANLEKKVSTGTYTKEEIELMRKEIYDEVKAQLAMNQQLLQETNVGFKERLQIAQKETDTENVEVKQKETRKNKEPYLTNLNEDELLSYVIFHFIGAKTRIGRNTDCDIHINGLNVLSEHAIITNEKKKIIIRPGQLGAKIKVNGLSVNEEKELNHKDRILIGSSHMYVFINPKMMSPNEPRITWEQAQKEIAEAKGFSVSNKSLTKEQQIIEEQIIELLPIVSDINDISEELNKYRHFEVILVPSIAFNEDSKSSLSQKVMIRMTNLQNLNVWLWDRGKLMNRKFVMQDHYQKYIEGEDYIFYIPKEEDPFWDPPEDLFIGMGSFFLQSLSYCMDFEDKAYITDYKGQEIGTLHAKIIPCNEKGNDLGEDAYTENPNQLLGAPFHFKVDISKCEVDLHINAQGFKIKYKTYGDEVVETPVKESSHEVHFNFVKMHSFKKLKQEHLNFFETGCITFFIYVIQKEVSPKNKILGLTTKELKIYRDNESKEIAFKDELKLKVGTEMDPTQIKLELNLLQRKYDILEDRDLQLQRLYISYSKKKNSKEVEQLLEEISKILNSKLKK